jgi:SAM-dependent methyltransferase
MQLLPSYGDMHEKRFWEMLGSRMPKNELEWLEPLRSLVSSIIVFGCWNAGEADGSCREAYALLRILCATSALIVDKEAKYIRDAQRWFRETQAKSPELFAAYDVEFAVSDMTRKSDQLGLDRFDLAYCSGVLHYMKSDDWDLQASVDTMARVVKPGGWIIACEDEGLDKYFEEAGLEKAKGLDNAPEYAYCYRKLLV